MQGYLVSYLIGIGLSSAAFVGYTELYTVWLIFPIAFATKYSVLRSAGSRVAGTSARTEHLMTSLAPIDSELEFSQYAHLITHATLSAAAKDL
ncbi:MAG: hypothetical protein P4L33_12410 [Capsulimonadaceae bacterium]|nr:hypothetical protein [Capsulimonadaceae bacterium]